MSQNIYVDRTLQFNKGGGGTPKIVMDADDSANILYVLPATDATEYVAFGNATKNMDVKLFGDTSGAYLLWDESLNTLAFVGVAKEVIGTSGTPLVLTAGSPILSVYATCATTDSVAQPILFNTVMTGAGGLGGRVRVNLSTNVSLGSYANAFKASVECNAVGGATGLLSVGCFEITMPTTGISGTTAPMELEITYGATCGALQKPAFIYANASGTAVTDFDTYGDFIIFGTGFTAATGKVFGAGTSTIRIGTGALGATKRYIPLSTAGDSFTTAYPIVSSGAGAVTAINVEGTVTLALGIGSTTALTTATTAMSAVKVQSNYSGNGYHIGNWFISQYTAAAGYGSLRTVVGQVDLSATQTTNTTAQYLVGVHGRAKVSGTAYNTGLFVTGVHGQILSGGTWTAADHVSAIWGDWQLNATLSGISSTEILYLTNNANNATNNPTNVMYIWAPYVTHFFSLNSATNGGMVSTGTASGTTKQLRCDLDGTDYYINMYPTPG